MAGSGLGRFFGFVVDRSAPTGARPESVAVSAFSDARVDRTADESADAVAAVPFDPRELETLVEPAEPGELDALLEPASDADDASAPAPPEGCADATPCPRNTAAPMPTATAHPPNRPT
jgi:hypothetical protein